jgi:hypothetical protein
VLFNKNLKLTAVLKLNIFQENIKLRSIIVPEECVRTEPVITRWATDVSERWNEL